MLPKQAPSCLRLALWPALWSLSTHVLWLSLWSPPTHVLCPVAVTMIAVHLCHAISTTITSTRVLCPLPHSEAASALEDHQCSLLPCPLLDLLWETTVPWGRSSSSECCLDLNYWVGIAGSWSCHHWWAADWEGSSDSPGNTDALHLWPVKHRTETLSSEDKDRKCRKVQNSAFKNIFQPSPSKQYFHKWLTQ